MGRGNFTQNSFLGGEWSPFSQGKTDQPEYYTAMNLSLNYLPTDEGALVRRSGTRLSAHAKLNTKDIRLIPFVSETKDAVICEVTNTLTRFHSLGTVLTQVSKPIEAITAATPAVVTSVAHGFSNTDPVVITATDAVLPTPVRNLQYTIKNVTADTFELVNTNPLTGDVDGTVLNALFGSQSLSVAKIEERTLPYLAAEVADMKFTEEEDLLFLFHANHEINTITRKNLVVSEIALSDGPYLAVNTTTTTLAFSATSGSITITASSVVGINDNAGFQTTDVGRTIRVNSGTALAPSQTWLRITAFTSTTVVTALVSGDPLAATTAVTTWRLGLYSDTDGHPTHGVIHEGRLWLISDVKAGRIDASKSFDFTNFEPTANDGTVDDGNAVSGIFAGAGRQNAKWLLVTSEGLLVGTDGGEYLVRASSLDDPISPFSLQVRRQSRFGAADELPVQAGRNTLFIQELGRSLIEYRNEGGQFDGDDISRQARHLTTDGLIELAYQKLPNPVVWALRGDGRLIGCTYRNDLEGRQVAWHRHSLEYAADETAGEDAEDRFLQGGASRQPATIRSITVAPFSDPEATRNDQLWVAIDREGTTVIEYLTPIFDASFLQSEGFLVDSGISFFTGDEDLTWEVLSDDLTNMVVRFHGLDRLNAKTVDGIFRGFDVGTAVVATGSADFTVPSNLKTAASAFETINATQALPQGLTFSSTFKSEVRSTTPNAIGVPNPQSAIIFGEDGIRYYILGGNSGVGGGGNTVEIFNADTGVLAFTKLNTDALIDADALGITPPDPRGPSLEIAATTVPDTPYVLMITGGAAGVSTDKRILYYRITSASTLVLDGGYAGSTGGLNVQFSPPQSSAGDGFMAAGHVTSLGTEGTNNTVAFKFPISLAWFGENRSTVFVCPSINFILQNTPVTENRTDHWFLRELPLSTNFDSNVLDVEDSAGGDETRSRGFFLPRAEDRGSLFAMMFYVADLEAHDAGTQTVLSTYLQVNATANLTGLISSTRVALRGDTSVFSWTANMTGREIKKQDDFFLSDGVTSGFPFADDKENFAGVVGSALDNYYGNPSIYPSDTSDPDKPWYMFFPRFYREAGDRDKFGVRVIEWNPVTETTRELAFAKGQIFILGTDVNVDTLLVSGNILWDRATNDITLLLVSKPVGVRASIVTKFGSFIPTLETIQVVKANHIDAIVGCNYKSRFKSLRPDLNAGHKFGTGLGKIRRVDQYALLAERTGPAVIGTDFVTQFDVNFTNPAGKDAFGRDPLFSQVAHGSLQSSHDFDNFITWEQSRPLPGTFMSLSGFSNISDR